MGSASEDIFKFSPSQVTQLLCVYGKAFTMVGRKTAMYIDLRCTPHEGKTKCDVQYRLLYDKDYNVFLWDKPATKIISHSHTIQAMLEGHGIPLHANPDLDNNKHRSHKKVDLQPNQHKTSSATETTTVAPISSSSTTTTTTATVTKSKTKMDTTKNITPSGVKEGIAVDFKKWPIIESIGIPDDPKFDLGKIKDSETGITVLQRIRTKLDTIKAEVDAMKQGQRHACFNAFKKSYYIKSDSCFRFTSSQLVQFLYFTTHLFTIYGNQTKTKILYCACSPNSKGFPILSRCSFKTRFVFEPSDGYFYLVKAASSSKAHSHGFQDLMKRSNFVHKDTRIPALAYQETIPIDADISINSSTTQESGSDDNDHSADTSNSVEDNIPLPVRSIHLSTSNSPTPPSVVTSGSSVVNNVNFTNNHNDDDDDDEIITISGSSSREARYRARHQQSAMNSNLGSIRSSSRPARSTRQNKRQQSSVGGMNRQTTLVLVPATTVKTNPTAKTTRTSNPTTAVFEPQTQSRSTRQNQTQIQNQIQVQSQRQHPQQLQQRKSSSVSVTTTPQNNNNYRTHPSTHSIQPRPQSNLHNHEQKQRSSSRLRRVQRNQYEAEIYLAPKTFNLTTMVSSLGLRTPIVIKEPAPTRIPQPTELDKELLLGLKIHPTRNSESNGKRKVRADEDSKDAGKRRKRKRVENSVEGGNGDGEVDGSQVASDRVEPQSNIKLTKEDQLKISEVCKTVGFQFNKFSTANQSDIFGYIYYAQKLHDRIMSSKVSQATAINGSAGGDANDEGSSN
ncbi:unnamed protein product [Ambrosiozyma monospora]|uniref:Unnamed protein product n=1 Tax=Ambrosiozyma monospora TaxID=43982 RepID=A0A9W6YTC9_AMBMO|nr:unnamed protein product [Ambrosiozyma monospora]